MPSSHFIVTSYPPLAQSPDVYKRQGYDIVHVEDLSLSGQVYYIISGHGGPDPGAVCSDCPSKMCEDEYALSLIHI